MIDHWVMMKLSKHMRNLTVHLGTHIMKLLTMAARHHHTLLITQVDNILLPEMCTIPTIITDIGLQIGILIEMVWDITGVHITGVRAQAAMIAHHLQCVPNTSGKVCRPLRRGLVPARLSTGLITIPQGGLWQILFLSSSHDIESISLNEDFWSTQWVFAWVWKYGGHMYMLSLLSLNAMWLFCSYCCCFFFVCVLWLSLKIYYCFILYDKLFTHLWMLSVAEMLSY